MGIASDTEGESIDGIVAGFEKDPAATIERLERIAANGDPIAMIALGDLYIRDSVLRDDRIGEDWYRRSYDQDHSRWSIYRLADRHMLRRDFDGARAPYEEGIRAGDAVSLYRLAQMYDAFGLASGEEINRMLEEAMKRGHLRARNRLSGRLMSGRYGLRNVPRGLYLYISSLVMAAIVGIKDPYDTRFW